MHSRNSREYLFEHDEGSGAHIIIMPYDAYVELRISDGDSTVRFDFHKADADHLAAIDRLQAALVRLREAVRPHRDGLTQFKECEWRWA